MREQQYILSNIHTSKDMLEDNTPLPRFVMLPRTHLMSRNL
jgi:hypothetical protein